MALPMLVGGTECGPSNPLQGFSKQFDTDRGIQQDHFGAGRAGFSRETFRSQQTPAPGLHEDAARFFASANQTPAPQLIAPDAFDLSMIHRSLPAARLQSPVHSFASQEQSAARGWASDFMHQKPGRASSSGISTVRSEAVRESASVQNPSFTAMQAQGLPGVSQWQPHFLNQRMNSMPAFVTLKETQQSPLPSDQSLWEKEFLSQENTFLSRTSANATEEAQQSRLRLPEDDLARTAALLIDSVSREQNPKFQNSQFLGLMRQIRDHEMVVEGNTMVAKDMASGSTAGLSNEFQTDIKGKGKAVEQLPRSLSGSHSTITNASTALPYRFNSIVDPARTYIQDASPQELDAAPQESEIDAYFRRENEEYTDYWNAHHTEHGPRGATTRSEEWHHLQRDWEQFEAMSTGIRPVNSYQFQLNNPYLLGGGSRSRHHVMHTGSSSTTLLESVLELEAAVQRDPNNAGAWFELGVKQQENEREQKAVQALQRAIELDPTHLSSWLALAVSYTNETNRQGTLNAIHEWISRNDSYKAALTDYHARFPENLSASTAERFGYLIQCLISMAQTDLGGDLDADLQIALAVLLNTNEDYEKAQDCFRTALAVRPDDWLLYNRVGATMANNGHAGDALQYYYRALELNPAYIRARFNLGISCINLRRYEEAAQHIMDALVLQDSDRVHGSDELNDNRGVTSTALWDSLKTACLHMQRIDLATLCDRQELESFRKLFQK